MGSNNIVFEGATVDAHETTLTVVDPTIIDRTITFQNDLSNTSNIILNRCNWWFYTGNFTTITLDNIVFEGDTDDAHETTLQVKILQQIERFCNRSNSFKRYCRYTYKQIN